jgi:allantoin racemase
MMRILIILAGSAAAYPAGQLPASLEARRGVLAEYVQPSTSIDVDTLSDSTPATRVSGGNSNGTLALLTPGVIERVVRAEADGYDAVVQYGMLDPGAEAARHFVRIPVVGTGRAGLLAAAALGDRVGGLVYQEHSRTVVDRMIRAYGLERMMVGVRAVGMPPMEMRARADELFERMVRICRELIDERDAQVILPLGLSMTPSVIPAARLAAAVNAPVVDGLLAGVRLAESLVLMSLTQSPLAYAPARLG